MHWNAIKLILPVWWWFLVFLGRLGVIINFSGCAWNHGWINPQPVPETQEITTTQVSSFFLHFSTFWDQFKISHTFLYIACLCPLSPWIELYNKKQASKLANKQTNKKHTTTVQNLTSDISRVGCQTLTPNINTFGSEHEVARLTCPKKDNGCTNPFSGSCH